MIDGKITIATGFSAKTKTWKNTTLLWSEIVARLTTENCTGETMAEYMKASKDDQLKIKDVGGYVGGYLKGGRRKNEFVKFRQLLTLDIDFGYAELWDDFCLQYDNAAVIHSSHKHTPDNPRYRLIIPLDREVTPDEYVAIARQVAGSLNIEIFDNTTFEIARLMFWPSNPKDVAFYARYQDGPWMSADEILASYIDWTDSSLWPVSAKSVNDTHEAAKKQEDPESKRGLIGAFCRTYDIRDVIEQFLSDEYDPTADGRYTYKKGSTSGGLVIYEDKFAYSHHSTDPICGKLCNAFDLVRIHRFGHLDDTDNKKSFAAMEELCRNDPQVRETLAGETLENAKYDFLNEEPIERSVEWMKSLDTNKSGKYLSSATNISIILTNDDYLKGAFRQNDFDGKRYIFRSVPWRRIQKPEVIKNVDYSGVRNYIESIYGISATLKVDDALALEFERNSFHPVKQYLSSLTWDGVERVDSLLIDFLGAEDSLYTREAIRKALVGAVARIFHPGVKFDLVLTLVGPQGTGKSTFVRKLGKDWFSDTFMTVTGKEALEQIQGAWLIEMAELSGLRKAEVESVKHFISKQIDIFRPAYARTSEVYPRQCVFFGTTNSKDFLRDPSGNRRFMPVDINPGLVLDTVFSQEFDDIIDQVWAEAVHLYKAGETLYLSPDAEGMARIEQQKHSETDERGGLVEEYLNKLLPVNWEDMDIYERREFLSGPLSPAGTKQRKFVCIAEIWCECLGKERDSMDRYKTREVNDIMKSLEDWDQVKSTRNFKWYGKQKYFVRKNS